MPLGDMFGQSFAAVNGQKPRNSDRIKAGQPLNLRGAFEAATNIPVVGDAISGGMALYDASKGDYGSAAMNALGVLPFLSAGMIKGTGKIADVLNAKHSALDGYVSEGAKNINLSKIVVPKELRNEGAGTAFMNDLVAEADMVGKTVTLTPASDFGGNKARLTDFYKRFGFVPNKGKTVDYEISEAMYRTPQPSVVNKPKLTEFEQRHLTEQKNAALPVEQGGLGLAFDNTAMDRAGATGFAAVNSEKGAITTMGGAFDVLPTNATSTIVKSPITGGVGMKSKYQSYSESMLQKYGAPWVPKATKGERAEYERLRIEHNNNIDSSSNSRLNKSSNATGDEVVLFHGSNDNALKEIKDGGTFGGLFASADQSSALGHGSNLYAAKIPKSAIATNSNLDTDITEQVIKNRFKLLSDDEYDFLHNAIVKDQGLYSRDIPDSRKFELFGYDNIGESDWAAQKLRGEIAKANGFKAVEMSDEHGKSYLVLPGNKITPKKQGN